MTKYTEADYNALIADLAMLETRIDAKQRFAGNWDGVYLYDTNVDMENIADAGVAPDAPEYWGMMLSAAGSAAGARAEAYGLDLNSLLGRVVY